MLLALDINWTSLNPFGALNTDGERFEMVTWQAVASVEAHTLLLGDVFKLHLCSKKV